MPIRIPLGITGALMGLEELVAQRKAEKAAALALEEKRQQQQLENQLAVRKQLQGEESARMSNVMDMERLGAQSTQNRLQRELEAQREGRLANEPRVVGGALVSPAGKELYANPRPDLTQERFQLDTQRFNEAQRHNKVMEAKPNASTISAPLTPEAQQMLAGFLRSTGQMPNIGYGAAGANLRSQIANEAAKEGPVDIAAAGASFKATSGALNQLQKNYSAVEAFSGTAARNRQLFDQVITKVPDLGARFLNAPVREAARQLGNPALAQFDVIRQSLQSEYARLINNPNLVGVLTNEARQEIERGLSPNATIGQLKAALDAFQSETENRKAGFSEQLQSLKSQIGGGSAPAAPAAGTRNPFRVTVR